MPSVEYKAKVLPDGHLSCPESVKKRLHLKEGFEVKIIIGMEELLEEGRTPVSKKGTGFCGIWKDSRKAEKIIEDIYSSRTGFKEVKI